MYICNLSGLVNVNQSVMGSDFRALQVQSLECHSRKSSNVIGHVLPSMSRFA
jgi:hypothetical protein